MSYILEALKKSEKKRQGEHSNLTQLATQETAEQQSTPPRRPLWPLLLGLALVINAGIMLLIFWPGGTPSSVPGDDMAAQTEPTTGHTQTRAEQRNTSSMVVSATATETDTGDRNDINASATPETPLVASPASPGTKTPMTQSQVRDYISASEADIAASRTSENNGSVTASAPGNQSQAPTLPENTTQIAAPSTSDTPAVAERQIRPRPDARIAEEPPPLYSELSSTLRSRLPELHMSVHAYSAEPSGGLVRVNNKMLRPGAYLQEGIRLEEITRGGAVFSYAGQKFLLPRR